MRQADSPMASSQNVKLKIPTFSFRLVSYSMEGRFKFEIQIKNAFSPVSCQKVAASSRPGLEKKERVKKTQFFYLLAVVHMLEELPSFSALSLGPTCSN